MAKSIVFCADGTWNGPGQGEEQEADGGRRTNVYKLFLNLDGTLAAGTWCHAKHQSSTAALNSSNTLGVVRSSSTSTNTSMPAPSSCGFSRAS